MRFEIFLQGGFVGVTGSVAADGDAEGFRCHCEYYLMITRRVDTQSGALWEVCKTIFADIVYNR